jgi:hypothetical protein
MTNDGLSNADLARLMVVFADSIEASGTRSVGFLREAARRLMQLADGCEQCGQAINRKTTGRPARFCSSRCRLASHRETKEARWAG